MVHGDPKGACGRTWDHSPARAFSYFEKNSLQDRLLFLQAETVWWKKKSSELEIWGCNGLWAPISARDQACTFLDMVHPSSALDLESLGGSVFSPVKWGQSWSLPPGAAMWKSMERRGLVKCCVAHCLLMVSCVRLGVLFMEASHWSDTPIWTFLWKLPDSIKTSGSGQGAPKAGDASLDD